MTGSQWVGVILVVLLFALTARYVWLDSPRLSEVLAAFALAAGFYLGYALIAGEVTL